MDYLKYSLIGLIISSTAFAGLPPTTATGQAESAKVTTFFLQAPNNQFTTTAASTRLLDTGNGNVLVNANFQAATAQTGWTVSNSTASTDTTSFVDGQKQTLKLTLSAQSGIILNQTVTPPTGSELNSNWEYNFTLKTTITGISICPVQNMLEISGACVSVLSDGAYHSYPVNYPGSSVSNGIDIKVASSSTGTVNVARAYAGPARNILSTTPVTPLTDYTMVISGSGGGTYTPGTTSINKASYSINGEFARIVYNFTQSSAGSGGSGTALFSLPSGITANTTKFLPSTVGSSICGNASLDYGSAITYPAPGASVSLYDSSHLAVSYNNGTGAGVAPVLTSALVNTTVVLTFECTIPISGSIPSTAVNASQTNYDWTAYTPTITGFGTASAFECQHKREGSDLLMRCKFLAGASGAVTATVSLPNGLTSAGTSVIPSLQVGGSYAVSSTNIASGSILIEPSVQLVSFGQSYSTSTNNNLAKALGNVVGASTSVSFTARVPIAGWIENQNAQQLIGSVVTGSAGVDRIDRAVVPSTCSTTPCSVTSGSLATQITRSTTGDYLMTFTQPFSGVPSCQCNNLLGGNRICTLNSVTASGLEATTFNAATPQDAAMSFFCTGPK